MIHTTAIAALIAYSAAAVVFLFTVLKGRNGRSRSGELLLLAGFVLQTALIFPLVAFEKAFAPESRSEYFFWLAWILPLLFFVFRKKLNFAIIGAFIAPVSGLFLTSSSYLVHQTDSAGQKGTDVFLILLHVLPALLAEISLVLAFIISCVFLIQESRLRRKMAASIAVAGPSLQSLENMNRWFIRLGFVAMSFAVISGIIWALSHNYPLFKSDFYQWSAIFVWLVLAANLHLRSNLDWSAKRLSHFTVLTIGVFLISFFIMTFVSGNTVHFGYGS